MEFSSFKHNATDIPRIIPIIALEEPLSKAMRQRRGKEPMIKALLTVVTLLFQKAKPIKGNTHVIIDI
jgi:hypothetical protein